MCCCGWLILAQSEHRDTVRSFHKVYWFNNQTLPWKWAKFNPWQKSLGFLLFTTQNIVLVTLLKRPIWKHCGRKRRYCWPAFSFFPTMCITLSVTNCIILASFYLLPASAFNIYWSKVFLLGKEVITVRKKAFETLRKIVKILVTSSFTMEICPWWTKKKKKND